MKKNKLSIGILAFVGLAVLNFTKSETTFAQKAMASSTDGSTTASTSDEQTPSSNVACVEMPCEYRIIGDNHIYPGKTNKCVGCNEPEAIDGIVKKNCDECIKGCIPATDNQQ